MWTAGLALNAEAIGLRTQGHSIVVRVDEVADSASQIGEKARAEVAAADDAAGNDRQVKGWVVSSSLVEFFAECGCPVGATQLPAIGSDILQALTDLRSGRG